MTLALKTPHAGHRAARLTSRRIGSTIAAAVIACDRGMPPTGPDPRGQEQSDTSISHQGRRDVPGRERGGRRNPLGKVVHGGPYPVHDHPGKEVQSGFTDESGEEQCRRCPAPGPRKASGVLMRRTATTPDVVPRAPTGVASTVRLSLRQTCAG